MNNKYNINEFVKNDTIDSINLNIVNNVKLRRKELNLTQKELSIKSGVTYASIRRFETSGEISLTSLLKIANVIGCLSDFKHLFENEIITNLKDYK